jgi:hypothetical protein
MNGKRVGDTIQKKAAESLSQLKDPEAIDLMIAALDFHKNIEVRLVAAESLERNSFAVDSDRRLKIITIAREICNRGSCYYEAGGIARSVDFQRLQTECMSLLGTFKSVESIPLLMDIADSGSSDLWTRSAARTGLAMMGNQESLDYLYEVITRSNIPYHEVETDIGHLRLANQTDDNIVDFCIEYFCTKGEIGQKRAVATSMVIAANNQSIKKRVIRFLAFSCLSDDSEIRRIGLYHITQFNTDCLESAFDVFEKESKCTALFDAIIQLMTKYNIKFRTTSTWSHLHDTHYEEIDARIKDLSLPMLNLKDLLRLSH